MIPQGGHLAGRHPVLGGRIRHAVHCERVGVPLTEAAGADAAALWRLVNPEEQVLGLDAAGYELLQLLLAADGGPRGCRIAAALLLQLRHACDPRARVSCAAFSGIVSTYTFLNVFRVEFSCRMPAARCRTHKC